MLSKKIEKNHFILNFKMNEGMKDANSTGKLRCEHTNPQTKEHPIFSGHL